MSHSFIIIILFNINKFLLFKTKIKIKLNIIYFESQFKRKNKYTLLNISADKLIFM